MLNFNPKFEGFWSVSAWDLASAPNDKKVRKYSTAIVNLPRTEQKDTHTIKKPTANTVHHEITRTQTNSYMKHVLLFIL